MLIGAIAGCPPRFFLPCRSPETGPMFRHFCSFRCAVVAVGLVLAGAAWSAQNAGPAVLRSAQSGPWSDPKTWHGGKVPGAGARVQIRPGHTVTYDVTDGPAIRFIHVAGILTFARDRSTTLTVGLIAIQPGDEPATE